MLEIIPQTAHIGAEIRGVDVRSMSDSVQAEVYAALLEHQVVFFRDSPLDDDEHMALAERFGQPSVFPLAKAMGDHAPSFQVILDDPASPPGADYWHTDVTWIADPPKLAFLRITIVPEVGGDTMWGSMSAAYDALSPAMKTLFEGLEIQHDNSSFIAGMREKLGEDKVRALEIDTTLQREYPPVRHPAIRTHPETGKQAVFFGGHFMTSVVGLEEHESDALLRFLWEHVDQPRFHCRWKWRLGDLAIWDERATTHRAIGDHFPRVREVRRCVIDGDRPFFRPG